MPWFRPAAWAALAITFLLATGTRADPVPEPVRASVFVSDMQAGRLLIRAGRLEHARAFLEHARPSSEEERIERLFLLGRIEMRLGMPARAAGRFEEILTLRPGLTRVRLELASAYHLAGNDDKARYHFGSSLAEELPSSVEAAVEGFLRRIDARKRWSVSVSASVLPETKRPERETVLIGGVPFRLSEDTRSSSGTGALVSAGLSFSPVFSEKIRGVLGASAAAKLYRDSQWNDITASGDLGLARLFGNGSASGGVRLGRRWTGGEGYHRSIGPWIRLRRRLASSIHLDMDLSTEYRKHDTRYERDGWRVTASSRFVHTLDGRTRIEAEPMFEAIAARRDHYGSRMAGLGGRVSRTYEGGFSISLRSSAQVRRYVASDPLFGKRRVDQYLRLGISVLHRSLRYRGFAPYVGFSIERNRSNIPIHEYRGHGVLAGVSRTF